jgi:hypothetical protein
MLSVVANRQRERIMTTRSPIPVTATHDILQRYAPPIKAGTRGEITDVGGASTVSYTVMFWPAGGGAVTLRDLGRMDLREA